MNDRRLNDAQITAALRAHVPAQAQAGLRGRVVEAVEITSQQRPLPSLLGAFSDPDLVRGRSSLLIAAALLLALALASAAAAGAWQLLRRDTVPQLDLTPPADVAAFVLSSYDRMPELPPMAISTLQDGSVMGRIYVDQSGAVRFEHYATPAAPQPDTYEILNGTRMGQLTTVGSDKVWVEQDGIISEDPRVFLIVALGGGGAVNQPGCGLTRNDGDVGDGTAASGWTYVGTESVAGRPTFHVTCGGGDLWIDIGTRLILRSQGPEQNATVVPVDGQPIPGSSQATETIEVTDLQLGQQPADLFELTQPAGVATMSSNDYQCQVYPAGCPSLSPPQPAYTPPARAIQGPLPSLPASSARNGWIAVSANPWNVGGGQNGDIYLVSEGVAPRRIIGSDGDGIAQACPTFSPDGQRLAYGEARASGPVTTYRGDWPVDGRAIVVVGVNEHGDPTPALSRFALPAGLGPMVCPEWSPTGRFLAFRDGAELWIADTASGTTRAIPITPVTTEEENELAWSRDGSEIAVAEPGQIRIVHVDGGASTVIPVEGAAPRSLGWTAGDDRIVYVSVVPVDEIGSAVHLVNLDGSNDTQLSGHGPAASGGGFSFDKAAVSPDGTQVAYLQGSSQCSNGGCGSGPTVAPIAVTDLYDSNRVEMSGPALPQGPGGGGFLVSGLQWSPDGKSLLLSSIDGVVSVGLGSGSPAIVYANGTYQAGLNLEWSPLQVTWQPVLK
jgi:Tol biopolymer transport system component